MVALGLCSSRFDLGFGVMGGLAVFQVLLLVNVARSMAQGRPHGTAVDGGLLGVDALDDEPGGPGPARRARRGPRRPGKGPRPMGLSHLLVPLLGIDITVGEHVEKTRLRADLQHRHHLGHRRRRPDRVSASGMLLRRQATSGVPGKLQAAWEMGVEAVPKQVDDSIGPAGAKVVPLALTLFVFIFICNLFEVLGIGAKYEWLPAPTGDINLPLAMALYVIVLVHAAWSRPGASAATSSTT